MPFRSLYASVLVAMVAILSLSFLAFHIISDHMEKEYLNPLFESFDELQLNSARTAYTKSGKEALHEYLLSLDSTFGGDH